jgi:hypothetical protein
MREGFTCTFHPSSSIHEGEAWRSIGHSGFGNPVDAAAKSDVNEAKEMEKKAKVNSRW